MTEKKDFHDQNMQSVSHTSASTGQKQTLPEITGSSSSIPENVDSALEGKNALIVSYQLDMIPQFSCKEEGRKRTPQSQAKVVSIPLRRLSNIPQVKIQDLHREEKQDGQIAASSLATPSSLLVRILLDKTAGHLRVKGSGGNPVVQELEKVPANQETQSKEETVVESPPISPKAKRRKTGEEKKMSAGNQETGEDDATSSLDALDQQQFSPLQLARMDRTILGLRPKGSKPSVPIATKPATVKKDISKPARKTSSSSHHSRKPSTSSATEKLQASPSLLSKLPKGISWEAVSVKSLDPGTLVWTKGQGLPLWPGVICSNKQVGQKAVKRKVCAWLPL